MADRDSAAVEPARVDFYVLKGADVTARLRLACRIAEKAYLASQSVLIWHTEAAELATLDEMLWTFNDRSFVPHEMAEPGQTALEAPVLLASKTAAARPVDLIINLAPDPPPGVGATRRIIEIIDGDEVRRRLGRVRWAAYRALGLKLTSHDLAPGASAP